MKYLSGRKFLNIHHSAISLVFLKFSQNFRSDRCTLSLFFEKKFIAKTLHGNISETHIFHK